MKEDFILQMKVQMEDDLNSRFDFRSRLGQEKASIMGTVLGLDSGKNFYSDIFEFLSFRACIAGFKDDRSRFRERAKV